MYNTIHSKTRETQRRSQITENSFVFRVSLDSWVFLTQSFLYVLFLHYSNFQVSSAVVRNMIFYKFILQGRNFTRKAMSITNFTSCQMKIEDRHLPYFFECVFFCEFFFHFQQTKKYIYNTFLIFWDSLMF